MRVYMRIWKVKFVPWRWSVCVAMQMFTYSASRTRREHGRTLELSNPSDRRFSLRPERLRPHWLRVYASCTNSLEVRGVPDHRKLRRCFFLRPVVFCHLDVGFQRDYSSSEICWKLTWSVARDQADSKVHSTDLLWAWQNEFNNAFPNLQQVEILWRIWVDSMARFRGYRLFYEFSVVYRDSLLLARKIKAGKQVSFNGNSDVNAVSR